MENAIGEIIWQLNDLKDATNANDYKLQNIERDLYEILRRLKSIEYSIGRQD